MRPWFNRIAEALAAFLAALAIYIAGFGIFDTIIVFGGVALLGVVIAILLLDSGEREVADSPAGDASALRGSHPLLTVFHLVVLAAFAVLVLRWMGIMLEQEEFFVDISQGDLMASWLAFAIIGYMTWRLFGVPMAAVFFVVLVYAVLPDGLGGAALDWSSIADRQWFTTDGVFGRPLQVVATTVMIFIVYGAVLQASGAGDVLLKIAFAATGRFAGGPAHAAIVGSAMFGTMSGAAIANVVSTGIFTIPIIKRAGFKAKFAGAVEAAASTGGQIMPPVMGVVAFIMADVTGIPYLKIVVAATIPAVLYYASLFLVVLIESRKQGIGATPVGQRETLTRADWIASLSFWIPLGVIIAVLLTGRTPQNAGFYALIVATVLCLILFPQFRRPIAWWQALVSAGKTAANLMIIVTSVGVVIGIVNMSGIGLEFADAIRMASGGSLLIALFLVMAGCIVMGMGVPSVTAYLILALVMGPALEGLGISKISAHMFMLYFGVLSVITPPVALAAFAAAPIAGAKPMETGIEAVRLAIAGFIIPFIFVYHPDILIIDGFTPVGLAWSLACFLLATWMIGTALAGFERTRIPLWESGVRLVAAIAILTPDLWSSLAGGLVAILLVGTHNLKSGRANALSEQTQGRKT
ncbi:TRAP transporter fused permease subunit [Oricola sp.]|uniref:TRAP transporter permease n=1 Tax=Oricola sp. TaxID=1979950 RepID=UPI0025E8D42D|nr:TRAP transporter fused permease subunit [Oricola sp.]MCI5076967.1 TRAP transporter fused permease subunit [Oricola sp.]